MVRVLLSLSAAAALAVLTGCGSLPSQGPLAADVVAQVSQDELARYLVVDVDERTAEIVRKRRGDTFQGRFGDGRPVPVQRIGVGDGVTVTIWEAAGGGLFSSPVVDRTGTGSRSVTIPDQVVSNDGAITVPYAGRIRVVGMTPPQVEAQVVTQLAGKAIEPQALVTISRNVSNTATVTGEVTAGARVPLTVRGDRLLDIISAAGGIRAPVHETYINLLRGGRSVTVPMQAVLNNPAENIYVLPGDVITAVRQPQTYTAFGATFKNAVISFESIELTMEEAIAKAGGLLELQADPDGVFLFRYEPVGLAKELDPTRQVQPGAAVVPVVYRMSMRDARSYFHARRFPMQNKDIIYVSSAPLTELQKLLFLVGSVTGIVTSGSAVRATLRN
ncbi:MAG TPA: polysaccharide biosynthesis/export family protein [Vineibacter sp.]|nr:polysaccharide biosynthesis/export family protein [Vineibacter sp.]